MCSFSRFFLVLVVNLPNWIVYAACVVYLFDSPNSIDQFQIKLYICVYVLCICFQIHFKLFFSIRPKDNVFHTIIIQMSGIKEPKQIRRTIRLVYEWVIGIRIVQMKNGINSEWCEIICVFSLNERLIRNKERHSKDTASRNSFWQWWNVVAQDQAVCLFGRKLITDCSA